MLNKLKYIMRKKLTRSMDKYDIDEQELYNMQKQGAKIIDVRSPQEYKENHIDGAILIPEYELKAKAKELLSNNDETIVVYCSSGIRSKRAQQTLNKMGYNNVFNLYDGLEKYWFFIIEINKKFIA